MTISYSKFKFTEGIFYKRIDHATITFSRVSLDVSIMPYINYSGHYTLDSIELQEANRVIFNASRNGFQYYVSISNDKRKIMIFNSESVGIILKQ